MTPIIGGDVSVKASEDAIKALNIQQHKKFKVNTGVLSLLKERQKYTMDAEIVTSNAYETVVGEYRA